MPSMMARDLASCVFMVITMSIFFEVSVAIVWNTGPNESSITLVSVMNVKKRVTSPESSPTVRRAMNILSCIPNRFLDMMRMYILSHT